MADLTASIEQQAQAVAMLQARLDDLTKELGEARAAYAKAYYIIGTEDELIKKGVVVKEGGANLLIKRVGRTLVPARDLKPDEFNTIDTRDILEDGPQAPNQLFPARGGGRGRIGSSRHR